ncbi:MAG: hypothetical protein APG08_00744 [Candidatus Methanofastidiosum methylothiophilum]|jgi:Zn finger protein HypA/HybF involved in hydrogenase expression|uniref:Uncharacterized protein n=1 Tax=Candidatus Methanofastidiosum methylothiophilum TaxID=1705564 RepID=A0A150JHA1_9EURY|nr:MAG: hypothetical protein AN188_00600 [Candidatus Methanofastidiosum methylthiophilus]MBP6932310.1 hypothetical protein [Methanofastidiosum sp.]OQC52660.1 MAG: hypothetical protein BWX56_00087 [Euryarchaeota archaeon ADurb.Bin023]KYC56602.1 MAG: hypothetical protein APG08_00744 [Candidatus Methanofastidiosum methylthiophilus]KYC58326.1 MAG: hypothetical protein APG09_00346 [Candidatus Methanofastidiosum methylthiophilus]
MGCISEAICKDCGTRYEVRMGGGFIVHDLHCDKCGELRCVSFHELGEIHLKFIKGIKIPYCVATGASDKYIQDNYPGEPINEDEYNRLVEEFAGKCKCGGNYTFKAPVRCPNCRSTNLNMILLNLSYMIESELNYSK